MAKSRRSRRVRRSEVESKPVVTAEVVTTRAAAEESANGNNNLFQELAGEYFYVYQELRGVLIITVLMFLVMFGLSFII